MPRDTLNRPSFTIDSFAEAVANDTINNKCEWKNFKLIHYCWIVDCWAIVAAAQMQKNWEKSEIWISCFLPSASFNWPAGYEKRPIYYLGLLVQLILFNHWRSADFNQWCTFKNSWYTCSCCLTYTACDHQSSSCFTSELLDTKRLRRVCARWLKKSMTWKRWSCGCQCSL